MRTNIKAKVEQTQEGAIAVVISKEQELRRTIMCCLLWEDGSYEDGMSTAQRIQELVPLVPADKVIQIAIEAKEQQHLRHVPLLVVRELLRHPQRPKIADVLSRAIQRADELAEFLSLYWLEGKRPIPAQVKKGLAMAFQKFDAYQLAKYNRDSAIKLRDVLFMVHAKPKDEAQANVWKKLADKRLPPPDTWEVALSAGADKKDTFTRLLIEKKLGYLALLRNLRNMMQAGVDNDLVTRAIRDGAAESRALPFRFVAAARAVPQLEPYLDEAMQVVTAKLQRLFGRTVILVDVSGSMVDPLSRESDLSRLDAASALSVLLMDVCEQARVFTFSESLVEVPPRRGMALIDAISDSQPHRGTYLGAAVEKIPWDYDRIIVVTDEQSADTVPPPAGKGYMINVATNQRGVGYRDWIHIDGFSEAILQYIQAAEGEHDAR